jgi:hypothetical protein
MTAACSAGPPVPPDLSRLLAETPEDSPARLWLDGDRVVGVAFALGPGVLPPEVRTAIDAVAPRGDLVFQGSEWGRRGSGYRIEKHYANGAVEHTRSALIATDGTVLERSHSVPLPEVPQDVLGAAMSVGPHVVEARIVSGPHREEYWECTVNDRIGHTHVATISLDGRLLRTVRRVQARVHV